MLSKMRTSPRECICIVTGRPVPIRQFLHTGNPVLYRRKSLIHPPPNWSLLLRILLTLKRKKKRSSFSIPELRLRLKYRPIKDILPVRTADKRRGSRFPSHQPSTSAIECVRQCRSYGILPLPSSLAFNTLYLLLLCSGHLHCFWSCCLLSALFAVS